MSKESPQPHAPEVSRKPGLATTMNKLASTAALVTALGISAAALAACNGTTDGGGTHIDDTSTTPDSSSSSSGSPSNGLNPDGTIGNLYDYCAAQGMQPNPANFVSINGTVPSTFISSALTPDGGYNESDLQAHAYTLQKSDFRGIDGVTIAMATEGQTIKVNGTSDIFTVDLPTARIFGALVTGNKNFDPKNDPTGATFATALASLTYRYNNPFEPGNLLADKVNEGDFKPSENTTPSEPNITVAIVPPCK